MGLGQNRILPFAFILGWVFLGVCVFVLLCLGGFFVFELVAIL